MRANRRLAGAQSVVIARRTARPGVLTLRGRGIMKIRAEFVTSAPSLRECPRWDRVEVALVGRSNVGKSSLLNALAGVHGLARVSKTPGRTRSFNFFAVGDSLAIDDLPGYGYAKMSRAQAHRISAAMQDFLARRANLSGLVLLVDSRRGPEAEELELAAMARERGLALVVAATKSDKLKSSERARALARFRALNTEPVLCSTLSGEGLDELRRRILALARTQSEGRRFVR